MMRQQDELRAQLDATRKSAGRLRDRCRTRGDDAQAKAAERIRREAIADLARLDRVKMDEVTARRKTAA